MCRVRTLYTLRLTKELCTGEGRRVDWQAAKLWALYLLAPPHYVTACLVRWARGMGRGCVALLLILVGSLQFGAAWYAYQALLNLLVQPSPPAALAIGYWLTTAGLVAGAGGGALMYGGDAWRGVNGRGDTFCAAAVVSLTLGCFALFGAWPLVLAPLQLSGAVHGLAP